jgi:hypothetical protein
MLKFAENLAEIASGKDKNLIRQHLSDIELQITSDIIGLPHEPTEIMRVFALYYNGEIIDSCKDITGSEANKRQTQAIEYFPRDNLAGFYFDSLVNSPFPWDKEKVPSTSMIFFTLYHGGQVTLVGGNPEPLNAFIPLYCHLNNFIGPPRQNAIGKRHVSRELTESIERNKDPVVVIQPPECGPTAGYVPVKYRVV